MGEVFDKLLSNSAAAEGGRLTRNLVFYKDKKRLGRTQRVNAPVRIKTLVLYRDYSFFKIVGYILKVDPNTVLFGRKCGKIVRVEIFRLSTLPNIPKTAHMPTVENSITPIIIVIRNDLINIPV